MGHLFGLWSSHIVQTLLIVAAALVVIVPHRFVALNSWYFLPIFTGHVA